ncbi:MAG: hypothetical protein ABSB95_04705 [Dissulfurispiraceae bacterium]|jgi:uncharacterized protein YcfL
MKKYFGLFLSVLMLSMLTYGCSANMEGPSVKSLYYHDAFVTVEKYADYPVTYRAKVTEAADGSMVSSEYPYYRVNIQKAPWWQIW